jgi:hypothetical protein
LPATGCFASWEDSAPLLDGIGTTLSASGAFSRAAEAAGALAENG